MAVSLEDARRRANGLIPKDHWFRQRNSVKIQPSKGPSDVLQELAELLEEDATFNKHHTEVTAVPVLREIIRSCIEKRLATKGAYQRHIRHVIAQDIKNARWVLATEDIEGIDLQYPEDPLVYYESDDEEPSANSPSAATSAPGPSDPTTTSQTPNIPSTTSSKQQAKPPLPGDSAAASTTATSLPDVSTSTTSSQMPSTPINTFSKQQVKTPLSEDSAAASTTATSFPDVSASTLPTQTTSDPSISSSGHETKFRMSMADAYSTNKKRGPIGELLPEEFSRKNGNGSSYHSQEVQRRLAYIIYADSRSLPNEVIRETIKRCVEERLRTVGASKAQCVEPDDVRHAFRLLIPSKKAGDNGPAQQPWRDPAPSTGAYERESMGDLDAPEYLTAVNPPITIVLLAQKLAVVTLGLPSHQRKAQEPAVMTLISRKRKRSSGRLGPRKKQKTEHVQEPNVNPRVRQPASVAASPAGQVQSTAPPLAASGFASAAPVVAAPVFASVVPSAAQALTRQLAHGHLVAAIHNATAARAIVEKKDELKKDAEAVLKRKKEAVIFKSERPIPLVMQNKHGRHQPAATIVQPSASIKGNPRRHDREALQLLFSTAQHLDNDDLTDEMKVRLHKVKKHLDKYRDVKYHWGLLSGASWVSKP